MTRLSRRFLPPAPPLLLLMAAGTALAGPADDRTAWRATVEFRRHLLGLSSGNLPSIEERITKHLPKTSVRARKKIIYELDRAYRRKYDASTEFLNATARMLAAGGPAGRRKLVRRFKAKRPKEQKLGIIDALAGSGQHALPKLLELVDEEDPEIAERIVRACAGFAELGEKWRKKAAKELAKQFKRIELAAGGKAADSDEMKLYRTCRPAYNETLAKLTGEKLNSADAWKAWLRDNITKDWGDPSGAGNRD